MIQSTRINGIDLTYTIANPKTDDIYAAFKLGATVKELGLQESADVAADLNYANNTTGTPIGRVIVNGKTVISDSAKTLPRDELYMLPDKSLHIGKAPKGALWALQGSPPLLRDGKDVIDEGLKRDQLDKSAWQGKHIQIGYGITAAGWLVVARTKDKVTLQELQGVMRSLGCIHAIKGDGGGSAYLWPADNSWGRKMGAALIIKRGDENTLNLIGDKDTEAIIDPGHGGADPGASNGGIVEKNITLPAALYIYMRFGELGIKRALTRDTDKTLTNDQRTAMIKGSGAKHCISCHVNAGGGDGVEVIHSIHNSGAFAKLIVAEIEKAGQNLRAKPTFSKALASNPKKDHYFMHRETGTVETNIVEFFFLDSKATGPNADLNEYEREQKDWWEAVVKAYCIHTGRKYTPPVVEPVKPKEPTTTLIDGFGDIDGHWALSSIRKAVKAGKMNGLASDRFGPDEPLTRAQFAVILDRLNLL